MIHGMGHIVARGGYAVHAVSFFNALGKLTDVKVSDLSLTQHPCEVKHYKADAHILLTFPHYFDNFNDVRFEGKKIGYTVVEHTDLSDTVKNFQKVDELWTVSQWCKDLLTPYYPEEKIKIIPEGVNPEYFNPQCPALLTLPKYKFLCVGRVDERKNIKVLVDAFLEEFEQDEDVVLIMANLIENQHYLSHRKILYVNPLRNHSSLGGLYTSCDCFVLPTRAEGWGLPICEAMACGLPVITTNYSSVTEFANESNAYMLDYKLVPIPPDPQQPYFRGVWADVDKNHLRSKMRYVYDNREEAKAKGAKASNDILKHFTWTNAANSAMQLFCPPCTSEQ